MAESLPAEPKTNHVALQPENRRKILAALEGGAFMRAAAKAAGISARSLNYAMQADPEFESAVKAARADGAEAMIADGMEILDNASTASTADIKKAESRANYRKWLGSKWNRDVYGDGPQVEVNMAMNFGDSHLQALRELGRATMRPTPAPQDVVEAEWEPVAEGGDAGATARADDDGVHEDDRKFADALNAPAPNSADWSNAPESPEDEAEEEEYPEDVRLDISRGRPIPERHKGESVRDPYFEDDDDGLRRTADA